MVVRTKLFPYMVVTDNKIQKIKRYFTLKLLNLLSFISGSCSSASHKTPDTLVWKSIPPRSMNITYTAEFAENLLDLLRNSLFSSWFSHCLEDKMEFSNYFHVLQRFYRTMHVYDAKKLHLQKVYKKNEESIINETYVLMIYLSLQVCIKKIKVY